MYIDALLLAACSPASPRLRLRAWLKVMAPRVTETKGYWNAAYGRTYY